MKLHLTGLGFLLCLAACQPAVQHDKAQSSSTSDEAQWVMKWRDPETENLKRFPEQATRSGDDLTISFGGKPTARFSDVRNLECEGSGTCSLWRFTAFVVLQSTPGKEETFAVVTNHDGESNSSVLLNAKGETLWIGETFKVSPDRRFLMVGEQEGVMSDGFLEVIDYASPHHAAVARFDAQCDPDKWDTKAAEVICSRNDENSVEVMATVEQTAPGQWRLREYKIRKNTGSKAVELRNQTVAIAVAPAPSHPDDLATEEGHAGLRRLTD